MQSNTLKYLTIILIMVVILFRIFPIAYDNDLDAFRAKADQGNVMAQFNLGLMYEKGLVVPQDHNKAIKWYLKAADQGHVGAQYKLGCMYCECEGPSCECEGPSVIKDYNEAIKWYRKAADQGHAGAQYKLGLMYSNGEGVLRDYVQAYLWIHLAAVQGEKNANNYKRYLRTLMTPEQISEARILARKWKPKNTTAGE